MTLGLDFGKETKWNQLINIKVLMDRLERLKNGTPHSRYFSDELGVPIFYQDTELVFAIYRNI